MASTIAPAPNGGSRPLLPDPTLPHLGEREAPGRLTRPFVGALLVWAFAPFIVGLADATIRGRVFLGLSGYHPMDGLQYLAWIRDAEHGLIRNLYGTAGGAVYAHPMWTPSGLVEAIVHVPLAWVMAFWDAVAGVVFGLGCVALVRHCIPAGRPGQRAVALVLAAFGGLTPAIALLPLLDGLDTRGDLGRAVGEVIPAMSLWGYAPLAIALGLMPVALTGFRALLSGSLTLKLTLRVVVCTLLVGWLHPWQGEILLFSFAALAAWELGAARGARLVVARELWRLAGPSFVPIALAAIAPLAYYLALSRWDSGWATSERISVGAALIPAPVLMCGVLPLVLAGLWAAARCRFDAALRVPIVLLGATLATVALSPSGEYRAVDGLVIPIGVLLVRAWPLGHRRTVTWLAIAAWVGVGAAGAGWALAQMPSRGVTAYSEPVRSDVRAVQLADRGSGPGALLSTVQLGTAIPGLVDRPSWLGHPIWTPTQGSRQMFVRQLFAGALPDWEARWLLRTANAAAVVQPCTDQVPIRAQMRRLGYSALVVGCAHVYLRGPRPVDGHPLRPATAQLSQTSGR